MNASRENQGDRGSLTPSSVLIGTDAATSCCDVKTRGEGRCARNCSMPIHPSLTRWSWTLTTKSPANSAGLSRRTRSKQPPLLQLGLSVMPSSAIFDWPAKRYKKIIVDEQVEALSLIGDVAVANEGPSLHLHAVLGRADGSVVGGHLLEAHVRPTLEVILLQPPSYLRKFRDPVTGLPLIAPAAS
jgi:uncharacterized protein